MKDAGRSHEGRTIPNEIASQTMAASTSEALTGHGGVRFRLLVRLTLTLDMFEVWVLDGVSGN